MYDKICVGCNQKFVTLYKKVKYCRWGCYLKYGKKSQTGNKNPNWKGGISIDYCHRVGKEILPNYCEICGKKEKLLIHHKNKNNKDNRIENLQRVCYYCHNYVAHADTHKRDFFKGKKHSKKSRKNMSISHSNRKREPLSEEHKKAISKTLTGRKMLEETKEKIRKGNLGKHRKRDSKGKYWKPAGKGQEEGDG